MPTQIEEEQAKEFLKRAEIRTMRKDLSKLREADSVKERDKIVHIKTLEEQQEEHDKKLRAQEAARAAEEKTKREEVLQQNEKQEIVAEKNLKEYATEEEHQQIFLLESERFKFAKEIDEIDKTKDPELKLKKNGLLIKRREKEDILTSITDQEKRLEQEQKAITDRTQATNNPSEKKGLEQSRWDLDKKIQDMEKRRWAAEKEVQDLDQAINQIDSSSEQNVKNKNNLRDKILGIDKSLREVYSAIMAREDTKKKGLEQEQIKKRQEFSRAATDRKEQIQREQWGGIGMRKQEGPGFMANAPQTAREKIVESGKIEEEQRKKFIQNVEGWVKEEGEIEIPIPVPKRKNN